MDGFSVTEIPPAGRPIRVIDRPRRDFLFPISMSARSGLLWVVNRNSLAEVNVASAQVVRDTAAPFNYPGGVYSDGIHVWVGNNLLGNSGTLLEFKASDGKLIRTSH
jgi:hypothetical protein